MVLSLVSLFVPYMSITYTDNYYIIYHKLLITLAYFEYRVLKMITFYEYIAIPYPLFYLLMGIANVPCLVCVCNKKQHLPTFQFACPHNLYCYQLSILTIRVSNFICIDYN